MTRIACGRRICVVVVRMALNTCQRRVEACEWIVGISSVIERDRGPSRGVVAGIAGCWERSGSMIWIRSPGEVRLMAAKARRGQRRVVVVHMALRARNSDVSTGERERCGVVIERRCSPGRGVMAQRTVGRKT